MKLLMMTWFEAVKNEVTTDITSYEYHYAVATSIWKYKGHIINYPVVMTGSYYRSFMIL